MYLGLLNERGAAAGTAFCFNTWLYAKIAEGSQPGQPYNFAPAQSFSCPRRTGQIRWWTKETVIIPIHLGVHWALVVVHPQMWTILYADSSAGNGTVVLDNVEQYLRADLAHKTSATDGIDNACSQQWQKMDLQDTVPQQTNTFDCGVFMLILANWITFATHRRAQEASCVYNQGDMLYFRKRVALDILNSKITNVK